MTRELATAVQSQERVPTDEIEVVISDDRAHIDSVLSVVHDGFVEAGYSEPQVTGRRLHPAYLNPGSCFALATIDGEAAGAVVVVRDGPFGVPSDRAFVEENDALRAAHPGPLLECGSLVVRRKWRRHTRRVFLRAISALMRVYLAESPHSPVVIAVSPQNERFYQGSLGLRVVGSRRPLYGPPALLMHTGDVTQVMENIAALETSGQRAMNRLIVEKHPPWFHDLRTGRGIADDYVSRLLLKPGVELALKEQIRLLAAQHPATLHAILAEAGAGRPS